MFGGRMQIRPMLCAALAVLCAAVAVAAIVSVAQAAQAAGVGARCGGAVQMRCEGALWCDPRPAHVPIAHARLASSRCGQGSPRRTSEGAAKPVSRVQNWR